MTLAANTPAHEPLAAPSSAPAERSAAGKPLVALTQDERLLAILRKVTDPAHQVHASGSEIDLATALMAHHPGVAVLDCAAIATPIAELTARLHAQFPELVLIVAGGLDDQGMLAAQITDGSVHRFLHKPVSEQRVRLFVEAGWRRHEEARAMPYTALSAPAPRRARRTGRWVFATLILAAAAGALVWFGQQSQQAPDTPANAPAAAPAQPAPQDPHLESLLRRADEALAAGALTAPAGANAAELYREARRRNARDPRAAAGLEQVISGLLAAGEGQLQTNHLDEAQRLAEQARAISADNPRVAFLVAQIGAQRERAVLGKAQRAAASGNVAGALAVLDDAARGGHRSTLAAEAREELAQKQADARVADYLGRGREALSAGRLIAPEEDNARFYIESARALAPSDPQVQQAAHDLGSRLLTEANQALAARNADLADSWASAAGEAGANSAEVASVHQTAQQVRGAVRADSFGQLALSFNQRLVAGKLLEPATDSARFYLTQLLQADAANPATQQARTAYTARVFDEERNALHAKDYGAARRWLAEARAAGADAAAVAAAESAVSAAEQHARQESSYVAESSLSRTRYVTPDFPLAARERGIAGWVDVQFMVRTDGTVGDAAIVAAQPVGIFEQAALDAVRRWRYRPLVQDGQPVSPRTRVRVRFAMQP